MRYLLDTNVCIRYLNGRSESLQTKILAADRRELAVCSVVKAELFYGAERSNNRQLSLQRQKQFLDRLVSLPFDDRAAEQYGCIRATLDRIGTPIGANDLMIAAIALSTDLTLVTHNTAEFSRVPGLRIEDWEAR